MNGLEADSDVYFFRFVRVPTPDTPDGKLNLHLHVCFGVAGLECRLFRRFLERRFIRGVVGSRCSNDSDKNVARVHIGDIRLHN